MSHVTRHTSHVTRHTSHVTRHTSQVIVCAGAVASPQLLQVSGIGPPPVLQAAGVRVRCDSPGVGENLQDHLQLRMVFKVQGCRCACVRARARVYLCVRAHVTLLLMNPCPRLVNSPLFHTFTDSHVY